ncbi:MAG: tyrosine-protein phosphatase [Proteobacteria bacterium]|nr:tyrosine-protein phosphatase [Pseudomonadota bacterium]HQR04184.1 tyrosine-protein phosphatase [Rhodocyclaceae bacterium]
MSMLYGLRRSCLLLILAWGVLAGPARAEDGMTLPRQVVLEGARNFRDMGGYATTDGRHVKFGRLYRSDNLSRLSVADWDRLRQLGLVTVVDFRTAEEVAATPPEVPADISLLPLPIGLAGLNIEDFRQRVSEGRLDASMLGVSYSAIAFSAADRYRRWFEFLLAHPDRVSVFHCTSGKDRTGLAAALFLSALGVPRETVLQDFTASNRFLHDGIEATLARVRANPKLAGNEELLRRLLGVERSQMEQTFTDIEQRYGSVDAYLTRALGVGPAQRERLRTIYLER